MLVRRESRTGANDLHTVYRPCAVSEILGNKTNVNSLKKGLDSNTLQHAMLFTGDAGCGKTTAARVVALGLNCKAFPNPTSTPCLECSSCTSIINHSSIDVQEINVGATGGKDAVDTIAKDLPTAPFSSRFKVLVFDEAHKLTSAAQDLLLKVIENGYKHVFFIFCTNHPEKLVEAFLTRCTVMNFSRLSKDLIFSVLKDVFDTEVYSERMVLDEKKDYRKILNYVAEECRGVPRTALVWLNQIIKEGSWNIEVVKEITGVLLDDEDPQIIEISREILKGNFLAAADIYDKLKAKIQAESVRIGVTAYIVGCLRRAKTYEQGKIYSAMLDILTQPIYEQGKVGDYKLYNYLFKATCVLKGK
jgi:DNA polymerase III subunit gamma/tau